ncbi:MAG: NfeD family protein [Armatimonas sp.]
MNFWESAAQLVATNPWVTILLLVAGSLLLFHDLLTPLTWGVTGTLGVLCLGAVVASHLHTHTSGWIGVVLLLAGLTLLLVETHLLPGHGVAAVFGLILLFAGMFWALGGTANAAFALSISSVLTLISMVAFFTYLPKSPVWKKLGQEMRQRAELGYVTADSRMFLLGKQGVTESVLRPAGIAHIEGLRVDVVTEGEFLEPGIPIVVTRVEGNRVVVDEAQSARSAEEVAIG